jgi:sec-independent protein translocase protein TatC
MSSAFDEDTARTVQSGRETVGAMLGSLQTHLQKVFIVFVVGLMGTILVLQAYVWDFLRANTRSQMSDIVSGQLRIITRTPFDVILVQVKIGLVVGGLLALPLLVYLSRDALRRRGFTGAVPVSRLQAVAFALLGVVLFVAGVLYAYVVFFPTMFNFLATNAIQAAVKPEYDIVMYVQFLVLLTISFGIAAQLPLVMSVLAYTEVVSYETFRDRWKYAVLAIFTFGAFFSPPDPFTQIMWAVPLCSLYLFSLGLAKLVTNVRRSSATDEDALTVRGGVIGLGVLFLVTAALAAYGARAGALEYVNEELRPSVPGVVRPGPLSVEGVVGVGGDLGTVLFGLLAGTAVLVVVVMGLSLWVLNQPVQPRRGPGTSRDPADIDLGALDAAGVRAAPPEAFLELSEDEAVAMAGRAMEADDPDRAQAILDRFDEVQAAETAEDTAPSVRDQERAADDTPQDEEDESLFASTAAGMMDPFTDDETTEDDVGGYYYDIAFILESLTSKAFRIVGVLMATLAASFFWLYQGGLGQIKSTFFRQVDPALLRQMVGALGYETAGATLDTTGGMAGIAGGAGVVQPPVGGDPSPGGANYIIALHPVEHLIFEVKVATIVGVLAALPVVMYYAWPAIKERGFSVGGDRRIFLVWGGSLFVGVILGSLVGFFYVSPAIISFLVEDALEAGMRISYRLNAFMWLIILTTLGIGLLADIPVTMWLFDRGGIVSYRTMLARWRVVVLGVFAVAGLALPGGTLTMFIIAVPVCVAYAVGLALLWTLALPGRLRGGRSDPAEPAAD